MASLSDYLDLTEEGARTQWQAILDRESGGSPRYTPVEIILCYGLSYSVNPHQYRGGTTGNLHEAPMIVHRLAALFRRNSAGAITSKMKNLDGSLPHGSDIDCPFYDEMARDPERFDALYEVVLTAARDVDIGEDRLPDFHRADGAPRNTLLGQDELNDPVFRVVVDEQAAQLFAAKRDVGQPLSSASTSRIAEHKMRIGQHRFAREVLKRFSDTCGFCGFAPRTLPGTGLLIASHIKPWAVSDNRERLDPRNGIAACPTHDAAFDKGLITVNGGLRVHRSRRLQSSVEIDVGVEHNFGSSLHEVLALPSDIEPPHPDYLRWHHERIYQDTLP